MGYLQVGSFGFRDFLRHKPDRPLFVNQSVEYSGTTSGIIYIYKYDDILFYIKVFYIYSYLPTYIYIYIYMDILDII